MKQKLIRGASTFIIVAAIIFLLAGFFKSEPEPTLEELGFAGTASIHIAYSSSSIDMYSDIPYKKDWMVYDLMKAAGTQYNIGMSEKDYGDMGIFIESINGMGVDASDGKWWQFWINGQYSQGGVSMTPISQGDLIEFKYTDDQYAEKS